MRGTMLMKSMLPSRTDDTSTDAAALPGHEAEDQDRAPQGDVDDQRGGVHEGSPFGYIRTKTKRPSAPASTGIGSEITIRHSVKSVPRIGNSQAIARP